MLSRQLPQVKTIPSTIQLISFARMRITYAYLFMWLLVSFGCQDSIPSVKDFDGPIFDSQLTTDTLVWTFDDSRKSFEFHQARTAESFLFREIIGTGSLEAMLPLPVHGGGLSVEAPGLKASLQIDMDHLNWEVNGQIDSMPISMEDYPISLTINVSQSEVGALVTPKDQLPLSLLKSERMVDTLKIGLLVTGFGGFNFENVRGSGELSATPTGSDGYSKIEMLHLSSRKRTVLYGSSKMLQGLSWSPIGSHIYFVEEGALKRLAIDDGMVAQLVVEGLDEVVGGCLHPDGTSMAISAVHKNFTQLFFLPAGGGMPKLKIARAPSYFNCWTSDGQQLLYTAARRGKQLDIYQTTRSWGREVRLTQHDSLDAGAAASPDGVSIFYHSNRSGQMKIWQMDADGQNSRPFTTDDDWQDWYPQPSPNGKFVLVHSIMSPVTKGDGGKIYLRLFDSHSSTKGRILGSYYGDLTKPVFRAWSPESDRIAFISN